MARQRSWPSELPRSASIGSFVLRSRVGGWSHQVKPVIHKMLWVSGLSGSPHHKMLALAIDANGGPVDLA
jgi:hypothetical protein